MYVVAIHKGNLYIVYKVPKNTVHVLLAIHKC